MKVKMIITLVILISILVLATAMTLKGRRIPLKPPQLPAPKPKKKSHLKLVKKDHEVKK